MTNTASIGSDPTRPLLGAAIFAITAAAARVVTEPDVQKAWANALGATSTAVTPVKHAIAEVAVACTVTVSTWRRCREASV
jgi:hypothetical protein